MQFVNNYAKDRDSGLFQSVTRATWSLNVKCVYRQAHDSTYNKMSNNKQIMDKYLIFFREFLFSLNVIPVKIIHYEVIEKMI